MYACDILSEILIDRLGNVLCLYVLINQRTLLNQLIPIQKHDPPSLAELRLPYLEIGRLHPGNEGVDESGEVFTLDGVFRVAQKVNHVLADCQFLFGVVSRQLAN